MGDSQEMLEVSRQIIDGTDALAITDVVLAETAFVLLSVYNVPRQVIVDTLVDLLHKANIAVFGLDKGVVIQALLLCRPSARVSFADAMLWAAARSVMGMGKETVTIYSFDQRFPTVGVKVRAR
jgi:predicted nucleic acid-binding protein